MIIREKRQTGMGFCVGLGHVALLTFPSLSLEPNIRLLYDRNPYVPEKHSCSNSSIE